jgi:hypothetical protein
LTPSEVCLPAAAAAAAVVFGETQKMDSQKMDSGEKRLLELGYKQELKRDLSYCLNYPALPPSPFLSTIPQPEVDQNRKNVSFVGTVLLFACVLSK